jgi:asparagine synthase (glutamine-hydrolysing)
LILELFERLGESFVNKLQGMFAIAILTSSKLYLFRDNFGKKPLYYSNLGRSFVFASELRSIKSIKKTNHFDRKSLASVLFYQSFVAPKTMFDDIYQLTAGEMLIWNRNSQKISKKFWYQPKKLLDKIEISNIEATKRIEILLKNAISKRVPKEVDFGALLSGGLDSSLVSALLSQERKIDTFSIGYEGFENYDERRFARVVAKHIDSNHTEVILSDDDFFTSLEEWIKHLDEPLLDPASIPLWHLIKTIKRSSNKKVLFSGDGSDEIFLGYRLYQEYLDIEEAGKLKHKNWLRKYFRANFSMNKEWERYKRVFDDSLLYRSMAELFTDLQLNLLLKLNVPDDNSLKDIAQIRDRFLELGGKNSIDWYSFVDIHTILAELFLKKLDRVTMAFSIEARSPFLDRDLVEFIFSLPQEVRVSNSQKALLKNVAKSYLPAQIIDRKKKGFSYPFIEWLKSKDELKVIDEVQKELGIFREDALNGLLQKSKKSKRFKHHIFAIYLLSKWLKKHYL